jgi:hypothetical protein
MEQSAILSPYTLLVERVTVREHTSEQLLLQQSKLKRGL